MALSWKLICLLLVVCGTTQVTEQTTQVPTTQAPTTQAPTTQAPTTQAPTTQAPTTQAPTTQAPTTQAPTTQAPTTQAPTTQAPSTQAPTTQAPTTQAPTTQAPTGPPPTDDPKTTDDPKPTDGPKPTEKPAPCEAKPCFGGSTCEQKGADDRVCLCLAGAYYDDVLKQCVLGKAFPGMLAYEEKYDPKMANKTSKEFSDTADDIIATLESIYTTTAQTKIHRTSNPYRYQSSVVNKLSEGDNGNINAMVDIMFDKDSDITTEKLQEEIEDGSLFGDFAAISLCARNACDLKTTDCVPMDGTFRCKCKAEYLPSEYTDRACVACPEGEEVVEGSCKAYSCPFGYSGFGCKDNWQLVLVIVGCVLGVLLLITTILLPVVAVTSKKKIKKAKATNYDSKPAKTPQVSNGLAAPRPTSVKAAPAGGLSGFGGMPRIPRATANDNWDRNTNLEMVPSNSRQNLIPSSRNSRRFDDDEDSNPYSRPMKPQNNPYAVGRPQINPYSSSQGSSNPYYRH